MQARFINKTHKCFFLAIVSFCLLLSGCVNGRIWGDNFLRSWFKGNKIENRIDDKKTFNTNIAGISGKEIPYVLLSTSMPLVILIIFIQIRQNRSIRSALSLLVTLIERCGTSDEIKRVSSIFSQSNKKYKKLVTKELRKLKS